MEKSNYFKIKNIERYINNGFEAAEQKEFEQQVQMNPELKEKVEFVKKAPNDLYILEKERLAQNVKSWVVDNAPNNSNSSSNKGALSTPLKIILSIAAVIILIGALIWMFPSDGTLDRQVQMHIAQVHQDPVTLRSPAGDNWDFAIENYTNRDFDKMLRQMELWIENENSTEEQLFYFALANLYATNPSYDIALNYLSKTENKGQSTYTEEIAWYRALIFTKQKRYEDAKSELMKIESSNRYGQNSRDLLGKMK